MRGDADEGQHLDGKILTRFHGYYCLLSSGINALLRTMVTILFGQPLEIILLHDFNKSIKSF